MNIPCEFSLQKLRNNEIKYACFLSFHESERRPEENEIKSFEGDHQHGKSDIDVEIFICKGIRVREFPQGFFKFFPNLTQLTIRNCSLTRITREVLLGLHQLEILDLSDNELTALPHDLFINKRKLREINLSANKIKIMNSKLFDPVLKSLVSLNFLNNPDFNESFMKNESEDSLEDFLKKLDQKFAPKLKMDVSETQVHKLGRMLSTGMLSDFVIKVEEREFKVHKSILAVQSSVFEAMFGSEMQENLLGQLTITDFSISAIEDFMHFFYTGVIKDYINGPELYTLACKYDVPDLKEICENIILENIDFDNAIDIFNLGHLHGCGKLKLAAFNEIERSVGFDLKESLIDDPQKLQEIMDAQKKMKSLMKDCGKT